MAKEDFKQIVVKEVELQWPRLNQPYHFDSVNRRTQPCEPTAHHAAWSVSWNMTEDDARKLYQELIDHFNECKTRNSKIGQFKTVFGHKSNEDGSQQFTAKRNCVNKSGKQLSAPVVVDKHKKPLNDLAIWSGSIGSVACSAVPVPSPQEEWGISLILSAVQVIEPQYGSSAVDEFDTYDSEPEAATAAASDPTDDIPFIWFVPFFISWCINEAMYLL